MLGNPPSDLDSSLSPVTQTLATGSQTHCWVSSPWFCRASSPLCSCLLLQPPVNTPKVVSINYLRASRAQGAQLSKHHKAVLWLGVRALSDTGALVYIGKRVCVHTCMCRQELVSLHAGIRRSMCRGVSEHTVMSVCVTHIWKIGKHVFRAACVSGVCR